MGRLFLAEGEDLLARFHPHVGSYGLGYVVDLLWIAYGILGFVIARNTPSSQWLGLLAIGLLAIPTGFLPLVRRHRPDVLAFFWAIVALGGIYFFFGRVPDGLRPLTVLALGVLATVIGLLRREFGRRRHLTAVTNRRIVLRGGIGRMEERTIDLDRIDNVRAVQSSGGQMFRYADLVLTLESRGRAKAGAMAPHETLTGVPDWEHVKHRLESAMEERRLTPKQREKAAEERRLKDSMHAVAGWAGREGGVP